MSNNTQPDITAQRPRYELLDGLRGVAAVLVIWYHFFEGFATSAVDQMINHGYLAVDFFFVLSSFVLGYAYDAPMRSHRLSTGSFIVRRIIRLQPLVVLSVLLGAAAYLLQGSVRWDGTPVPLHQVLTALLLGLFMIPVLPGAGAEVRGNGEMFPLNGPGWSLFFEYIGSIIYATVLYRLGRRALACITVAAALCLAYTAFGNMSGAYHLGVGWSMADYGFWGGFSRLVFSFSAGLLIQRCFKPRHIKGAFWLVHGKFHRAVGVQCLIRHSVHHFLLPRDSMARSLRHHYRPYVHPPLQLTGKHILPRLHSALPGNVSVLCLGMGRQPQLC